MNNDNIMQKPQHLNWVSIVPGHNLQGEHNIIIYHKQADNFCRFRL